jgi:hypothetical protein
MDVRPTQPHRSPAHSGPAILNAFSSTAFRHMAARRSVRSGGVYSLSAAGPRSEKADLRLRRACFMFYVRAKLGTDNPPPLSALIEPPLFKPSKIPSAILACAHKHLPRDGHILRPLALSINLKGDVQIESSIDGVIRHGVSER